LCDHVYGEKDYHTHHWGTNERRRGRERDEVCGAGFVPSQCWIALRIGWSGKRCKFLQRGPERIPDQRQFYCILAGTNDVGELGSRVLATCKHSTMPTLFDDVEKRQAYR